MRIALIADLHANLPALRAVLADAEGQGADRLAFLGDYALGLGWPGETLALLRGLARDAGAVAVAGNEEALLAGPAAQGPTGQGAAGMAAAGGQFGAAHWVRSQLSAEDSAFLAALPEELALWGEDLPAGAGVRLFHKPQRYFEGTTACALNPQHYAKCIDSGVHAVASFAGYAAGQLAADEALNAILGALPPGVYAFGHTHIQWAYERNGRLLVNPGSAGLALDFQPDAAYALLEWGGEGWRVVFRRVAYDVAATLAQSHATPWAQGVPVWSNLIGRELETAREQAYPFLHHAEAYAVAIGDGERPFSPATWAAAHADWLARGLSKG